MRETKRVLQRIIKKAHPYIKKAYWLTKGYKRSSIKILFIAGCQRSGTNMMNEVFENDLRIKVYDEFSKLSSNDPAGIRLNSLASVKEEIDKQRASLIVLKPLVESQNLRRLLDYFSGSKALWMYRHYKDVARSNLGIFGIKNGVNNLRPIVKNDKKNWRSEKITEPVKKTIVEQFSEEMNPWDAAALFWYTRNMHFFDQNRDQSGDVLMCKYEDFVVAPI